MRALAFPPPVVDESRAGDPRISVVVITRDRPEHLRRCLESLMVQTQPPADVIVIDSSDGRDSERVAAAFPGVRHVRFPAGRRGMPAARNAGIRLARADVVAFLDDDCEASAQWMAGLTAAYRDPGVIGAGGKVIDEVITLGRVRRFLDSGEPWTEPDDGDPRPGDVDFLQGGNMSFRRDALMVAGGFDPGYTGSNYREETDLCFRLRRRGHRLRYVPAAAVTHRRAPRADGVDRSPESARREYFQARNQTYFILKNYGAAPRPLGFYLVRQTLAATAAAARQPSRRAMAWWAAHLAGKAAGVLAGARYWWRRASGRGRR